MCFVSGVRLHFYFMPELIYFYSFHLFMVFEEKKIDFLFVCRYWNFNASSSSFPIQCVISIVAHTHIIIIIIISLLISFHISLSLLNRFITMYVLCVCGFGIISLLWAHTVKILLLLLSKCFVCAFFHHFIN